MHKVVTEKHHQEKTRNSNNKSIEIEKLLS